MNWVKQNINLLFPLVGIVFLSLLLFNQCEKVADLKQDIESTNNFWENEEKQWISRDSIRAHDIAEMEMNLMTEASARQLLEDEFNRFKKIQSHVRTETITRVDSFFIPYDRDTIDLLSLYDSLIPIDTVNKHFIQIPKSVSYSDTWFAFAGNVDSIGLTIDSLRMINKFDVTIGWKKPDKPLKFLRRKEPVVELISYNPYTEVNYVNNIVVQNSQGSSLVEKIAFAGGGFVAGFVAGQIKQ